MRILFFCLICMGIYSCQPELDDSILDTDPAAQFVLTGSPNTCSNIVPSGVYKKNTPLTSSNKITIDVNVSKTGTWSASSNGVNGITFSGSGSFTSSGSQTITLQGSGTPTQDGQLIFTLTAGGAHCTFTLTVDNSTTTNPGTNIPPVANAGQDKSITLPTNAVTLTGSGTDADGSITSYVWSRIAGPASSSIVTPTLAQTIINSLVQGTYQFELKVTDNAGATGKDTVTVIVNAAPPAGAFAMQQELFFVISPINDIMQYDAGGKVIKVNSNHYPDRVITYSNNKIATIEYWYDNGSGVGNMYKGQTHTFIYDANGNVITINETDHVAARTYLFSEYTYNSNNTLNTKRVYFPGGTSILSNNSYVYTNGNVTGIVDGPGSANPDTTHITYDTRVNNFKTIYPQNYFLDIQTVFAQTNRSEMFYFSQNYPLTYGNLPVSVSLAGNQKPFEVKFDNVLWYRYIYQ